MPAVEMTLTRFLRHSGSALDQVDSRDLRLQRRDGEDLYLKRADREEAEQEILAATGRMLVHVVRMLDADAILPHVVEDAMPWSRFLPEADRAEFVAQFARTVEAAAELGNLVPAGILLNQWKTTAEAWADPALCAALEAELEEGPIVERPAGAT
jgi:hypothetical protein